MKSGTGPTRIDHRDWLHTFGSTTITFPTSYSTDAFPLSFPNQDIQDPSFSPPVPPEPNGCTNETQSSDSTDLTDGAITYRPDTLEAVTHANAKSGIDIRTSLLAIKSLGWITGFFNVQPQQLDWFDTIRLAMISGIPEKRSVSLGTPWFPEFEQTNNGILPMPTSLSTVGLPWHNHKICGWKIIGDQTYLIDKSWQGPGYGDGGYCYWSRSLVNSVMPITGTVAFTTTRGVLPPISTVPVTVWQWLISNLNNLLGLSYGSFTASWWEEFWSIIEEALSGDYIQPMTPQPITPAQAPVTPYVIPSRIIEWANAIKVQEGAKPSLNNPGNLKYSTLTASWGGSKGFQALDGGWICSFPTDEAGFTALCNFLTLGAEDELLAFHQARTLQAFSEVYAGNPPQDYIDNIAKALQVPVSILVAEFLPKA